MPLETLHFGSAAGITFAFFFFAGICGFIGFAVSVLLTHPRFRREPFHLLGIVSRTTGFLCGGGLALLLFLWIYFTALDGFQRLEVQGNEIRLSYILPSRTQTLPRQEVVAADPRLAYRFSWRLVLRTDAGETYESAQSNRQVVQEAAKRVNRLIHESP